MGAYYAVYDSVYGTLQRFILDPSDRRAKSPGLQINPDAGNLGGKVGFIFLGMGLIAAVGGWYLYPETKVRAQAC